MVVSHYFLTKQFPLERINDACSKILMAKFKLGLFENRTVKLEAIKNHVFIDTL